MDEVVEGHAISDVVYVLAEFVGGQSGQGGRYIAADLPERFRPALVLASAQACGLDADAVLPVACAVEAVHTYSLIHDDLPSMDNADWRRGRPTCHVRYGEAIAILPVRIAVPRSIL